ncbi:hypothetical protein BH18THE2_BH18THE2_15420 [soil metagenome]
MNNKMLTIAALAAVLVAGVFATTPMAAYADGDYDDDGKDNGDYSGTETEQEIKQKNVGSDASTNVNCGDNDINSGSFIDAQVCGTAAVDLGPAIPVR